MLLASLNKKASSLITLTMLTSKKFLKYRDYDYNVTNTVNGNVITFNFC